jgi:trimeric autotransporter adhesin
VDILGGIFKRSHPPFGHSYTISTFAGGGLPVNVAGPSASIGNPSGIAADAAGNIFLVGQNALLRLDGKTGILTRVAGNGTPGFSGDGGPATSAQLAGPSGVAVDSAGTLYIADSGNYRVRKVANGIISTVAGNGTMGFSGDQGPATSAQLSGPNGIAVDSSGNLYICDSVTSRVRKVSGGVIASIAGTGFIERVEGGYRVHNPATDAQLIQPRFVAVDAAGNVYIADYHKHRIRKVSNGAITTVAGTEEQGFSGDGGPATSAQLWGPSGVAVDSTGALYIADTYNHRIRQVSNGIITTVVGNGTRGFGGDNGPANAAALSSPESVAVDSSGNVYITDRGNGRIRKVSNGVITTVAGTGTFSFGGDGGPATSAQLHLYTPIGDFPSTRPEPLSGVAVDSAGNVYIADELNQRVRRISGGVITTIAGSAATSGRESGDNGPATSAELRNLIGVAVDSKGTFYVGGAYSHRIRKVSGGVITTVAGNGTSGFSGDDGPAASAQVNSPLGVAVDSAGNLFIADTGNHRIRKVSRGVITTVAGNGTQGFSGDNGPALSAQLSFPRGIAVDSAGSLYFVDGQPKLSERGNFSYRVRKVSKGVITTVAGGGASTASPTPGGRPLTVMESLLRQMGDNGPATSARLFNPVSLAVDSAGDLYIADVDMGRIRKVSKGVIATIAGGGASFGDHGPATNARLSPRGLAVDRHGNIYVADSAHNRIRLLKPSL